MDDWYVSPLTDLGRWSETCRFEAAYRSGFFDSKVRIVSGSGDDVPIYAVFRGAGAGPGLYKTWYVGSIDHCIVDLSPPGRRLHPPSLGGTAPSIRSVQGGWKQPRGSFRHGTSAAFCATSTTVHGRVRASAHGSAPSSPLASLAFTPRPACCRFTPRPRPQLPWWSRMLCVLPIGSQRSGISSTSVRELRRRKSRPLRFAHWRLSPFDYGQRPRPASSPLSAVPRHARRRRFRSRPPCRVGKVQRSLRWAASTRTSPVTGLPAPPSRPSSARLCPLRFKPHAAVERHGCI